MEFDLNFNLLCYKNKEEVNKLKNIVKNLLCNIYILMKYNI